MTQETGTIKLLDNSDRIHQRHGNSPLAGLHQVGVSSAYSRWPRRRGGDAAAVWGRQAAAVQTVRSFPRLANCSERCRTGSVHQGQPTWASQRATRTSSPRAATITESLTVSHFSQTSKRQEGRVKTESREEPGSSW